METLQYERLIEAIYDAALDPQSWPDVIVELKTAFRSTAAGFFVQTADHRLRDHYIDGIDASEMARYGTDFAANNPWFTIPGLMRPGRILTDLSLDTIHQNRNAFVNTEMYREWCLPLDFRHLMGGNLIDRDGNLINFSFFRPEAYGHYSEQEKNKYRLVSRHLMKAIEINSKIAGVDLRSASNEVAMEKLGVGLLLLDSKHRIGYMNVYAEKMLAKQARILEQNASIKFTKVNDFGALNAAIDTALSHRKSACTQFAAASGFCPVGKHHSDNGETRSARFSRRGCFAHCYRSR